MSVGPLDRDANGRFVLWVLLWRWRQTLVEIGLSISNLVVPNAVITEFLKPFAPHICRERICRTPVVVTDLRHGRALGYPLALTRPNPDIESLAKDQVNQAVDVTPLRLSAGNAI